MQHINRLADSRATVSQLENELKEQSVRIVFGTSFASSSSFIANLMTVACSGRLLLTMMFGGRKLFALQGLPSILLIVLRLN